MPRPESVRAAQFATPSGELLLPGAKNPSVPDSNPAVPKLALVPAADSDTPERGAGRPPTILCVEDEALELELRKMVLEQAGFRVLAAKSGKQALEMLHLDTIDAAVVDYWMPGMNGLAVAEAIKRRDPKIPVIIFSAYSALPDELIGVADAWLQKADIEPPDLIAHLRRFLAAKASA